MRRLSFCVAVCSSTAESVRHMLIKFGILDRRLKVEKVNTGLLPAMLDGRPELVLFPLSRPLSVIELERIRGVAGLLHFCFYSFVVIEKMAGFIDLLKGALPENLHKFIPRSFDVIGDIAILELSPEIWDFRGVIGEAVLRANRHVKVVFAKGGRVDGIYRVRRLVHVAGEERTITLHRENGCVFMVDVAGTYFSPRLSGERIKVANQVKPGEVVVDLFAGVGPFAILIAKKKRGIVHAIDINPFAIQLLKENIKLNKVSGSVHPYLGDCREVVKSHLRRIADHVIMNFPSLAYEFIDVACSALKESGGIIHYYQFGRGEAACNSVVELLTERLKNSGVTSISILNVRRVRSTAPREWQVAVDALIVP